MSLNFLHNPITHELARCVRRMLVIGAAAIGSMAIAQMAAAQTAPAGAVSNTEIAEIVVTGSVIRRADTETPSPIQIISEDDIKKSGFTSVSDMLHNLSANGAGSLNNSFSGAFAGGGNGIALRGLSVGATLTLIDGHRMVGYPLTDDGERNFVDVTSLPINAVERIEVLKDGASAEYGSDAIAGVVNVILKKTFNGLQIDTDAGVSGHNDGTLEHASVIWGTGDLIQDGWNFYTAASFRHQDPINFNSRHGDFTNLDFRGVGGVNTTPGAGSDPLVFPIQSKTGYLLVPNGPNAGSVGAFLPGCTAAGQAADQCTFLNPSPQLQPSSTTGSILSKFSVNLPSDWKSTTTASIFLNKAEQQVGAYPTTATVAGGPIISLPPGGIPVVHPIPPTTVPANYPGNPYGVPAQLIYDFSELGQTYTTFNSSTYRVVEDLDGTIAGWDIGISAGYMYAFLRQDTHGLIDFGALQTALNNDYVLGSASGASIFAPTAEATDSSNLYYLTAHASKGLFQLPSGKDFALAFGLDWNEKKLNATSFPSSLNGTQGANNAFAIGSQADSAAFVEVDAPIIKGLEANAAVRYDHYNTGAGGQATPKFGVKYAPIDMLTLRATWGKGFRAPSIAENNSGLAFLAGAGNDPVLCPDSNPTTPGNFPSQCSFAPAGVQSGNKALQPEKSTNFTAGFVFEPSKRFNVSVDYYDIKINQDIISAFEAGGLGLSGVNTPIERLGPIVTLPQTQPGGGTAPAQTPVPLISFIAFPYLNGTQTHTNGVDVDLRSQIDAGIVGDFSATLSYTRILSYVLSAAGIDYQLAGTHGPSGTSGDTGNPKNRGTLVVGWQKGPVSANVNFNYVGGFSITDPSAGQTTCQAAINSQFANGTKFVPNTPFPSSYCNVRSFLDVDLITNYQFTDHLSMRVSVLNVFDKPPPFDAVTYGGGGSAAYSTLDQAGAVGRFYQVGATYKF
jgi:iron complex outermembrane recepter protein